MTSEMQEPGDDRVDETGSVQDAEPVTAGTLFIMMLFLMALAGMWGLMYLILLER